MGWPTPSETLGKCGIVKIVEHLFAQVVPVNIYLSIEQQQTPTTMSKMTDIQQTAADHIHATDNGDGTVTYYDDGTQKHYVCQYADLDRLAELLNADGDEYPSRDAYSLWCSEYSHAEA